MPAPTTADALRLAINALRDVAESRKMPSGIPIDGAAAELHAEAADVGRRAARTAETAS